MSHRVPGEALSRRLNAREYRRPKMGFEPRSMLVGGWKIRGSICPKRIGSGPIRCQWMMDGPICPIEPISNIWRVSGFNDGVVRTGMLNGFRTMRSACWEWLKGVPVSHHQGAKHSHGMVRRLCIIWRRSQTLSPKRPRNPKSKHEPFDRWADPLQGFHFHGANPKRW